MISKQPTSETLNTDYMQGIDFSNYSYNKNYACSLTCESSKFTRLQYLLIHLEDFGFDLFSKYLVANRREINRSNQKGWTALNIAARNASRPHYLDVMRLLLKYGAEKDGVDPDCLTPLMHAATKAGKDSNLEAMKILLEAGADVNAQRYNKSVLYRVIEGIESGGSPDAMKMLINAGADVNFRSDKGHTLLMIAAENVKSEGGLQIVKMLVDLGIDVNACTIKGNTILTRAKYYDFESPYAIATVKYLVEHGATVTFQTKHHWTPMLRAVLNCNEYCIEILKTFIEAGVDVNTYCDGWTPLKIAAQEVDENGLAVIRFLVEMGANLNIQGSDAFTPLMTMVQNMKDCCISALEYLIDKGADVYYKTSSGVSALTVAINNISEDVRYLEALRILIQKGADLETEMSDGFTPLAFALSKTQEKNAQEAVKLLLKAGANPNARNSRGFTPLMILVKYPENPFSEMIPLLIKHGADPNLLSTTDHKSALKIAFENTPSPNIISMIRILLQYGANPHELNYDGKLEFINRSLIFNRINPNLADLLELFLDYMTNFDPFQLPNGLTQKQRDKALKVYNQHQFARTTMRTVLKQIAQVSREVIYHPDSLRTRLVIAHNTLSPEIYKQYTSSENSILEYLNISDYEAFCWKIRDIVAHL